jgi:hypothetical protein
LEKLRRFFASIAGTPAAAIVSAAATALSKKAKAALAEYGLQV